MLLWYPLFTKDIKTLDKVQNIDPKLSEFEKDTFILKLLGICFLSNTLRNGVITI